MLTSMQDVAPAPPGTRIPYSRGEFQFGELRVPSGSGPHPVAIVIHGGYWRARYDLTEVGHLCQAVTRQGLATWSLEYRRIGNPGGGWPGTLDDVRTGAAHLEKIAAERSLDLKRVVAMGHSAGELVPLGVAQRVLHGENDDIVPLEISRRYVAAAKKSGDDSKLIEVAGAGHFELIDPRSSAWPVVQEAVIELVK
jgi:dipeptidyl aminopeptidase/acylaminoacyl peptidase